MKQFVFLLCAIALLCVPAFAVPAVPTFSLASGNYTGSQSTTLSDSTGGATISYCTTTGATGNTCTPGTTYSTSISITSSEYICANATLSGTSATVCNNYSLDNVPLPVQFSPSGGSISGSTSVTLSTDTVAPSGTTMAIYYTTDGSTPDYTSAQYTGTITVSPGTTVKALAGEIGFQVSNDQLFAPNPSSSQTAAAPASYPGWKSVCASGTTCDPGGNNLPANTFGQTTVTTGCVGSSCQQFLLTTNANLTVGGNAAQTNVLYAFFGLHNSSCDKCTYSISKFSVNFNSNFSNAGEFEADQAIFRSTLPVKMNTMYGFQCNRSLGKWQIDPRTGGWVTSPYSCSSFLTPGVWHTYVMMNHIVLSDTSCTASGTALPTQHYDVGIFDGVKTALNLTNCAYPLQAGYGSAALHQYQIDQTKPSSSSSFLLDNSSNLGLFDPSAVSTAAFTVPSTTATPTLAPTPGSYTPSVTVSLSDTTPSSTIYYTTNGSTPTTSSTVYTAPFTLSSTATVKAMATASGLANSAVASGTYTITAPAATPTLSPAPGSYSSSVAVTLSDTTSLSTIYYTTDGSTPTTSSTVYTAPFTLTATATVKAMATASGFANSAVASGTYTITLSPGITVNLNGMQQMTLNMQGNLIAAPDGEGGFTITQLLTDPVYNSVTANTLFLGTIPVITSTTAPTGSCSALKWVLSNEPHISFCNGTTWSTLI